MTYNVFGGTLNITLLLLRSSYLKGRIGNKVRGGKQSFGIRNDQNTSIVLYVVFPEFWVPLLRIIFNTLAARDV